MKTAEYESLSDEQLKSLISSGDLYAELKLAYNRYEDLLKETYDPQAAVPIYTKLAAAGLLTAYWYIAICYAEGYINGETDPIKELAYLYFVKQNLGKSDIAADMDLDDPAGSWDGWAAIAQLESQLNDQQINEAKAFCETI